jgi:ATP-binding cassette, subfamily B, bacterial
MFASENLERVRTLYRVFGPYLKPYRRDMVLAYVALGATVGMSLLRPWPLKLVLDSVLLSKRKISETVPLIPNSIDAWDPMWLLTLLCGALVLISALEGGFSYLQKYWFSAVGQSAATDVQEHVHTHLQTLPRGAGLEARTGDVVVRLTSDIKTLRDLLVEHVQKLGTYVVTFLGTLTVMFLFRWDLTLISLSVVPLIWWASYRFSHQLREASREKRRKEGDVAAVVQESLTSLTIIQAFAQEEAERERLRQETRQSLGAGIETSRIGGAFSRSVKVLNTAGIALLLWFGARRVLEGALSPGDLIVLISYANELYLPVQNISELTAKFMESVVSAERVLQLLHTKPLVRNLPRAVKLRAVTGEVTLENVIYGYVPEQPILRGLSLTAQPGRKIAIVGESGTGKSTILNLLLRFADPWQGRVLIDGYDVRHYTLKSLRSQMSVVLQEPVIFRRSVRDNIAYGMPHAGIEDVVAAAHAAHAHDFIMELPRGYDTLLEERGTDLSGGQKQRIALARAFLRNSKILILDEPTASLDPITEAGIMDTLYELAEGRTTIIIAHRLSTVERVDEILVLDGGCVVQRGSHADLMAADGPFRRMWEAQSREWEQKVAG